MRKSAVKRYAGGKGGGGPDRLWRLFAGMSRTGARAFGSGFVIVAPTKERFVNGCRRLGEEEMPDRAAPAQSSPGQSP